MEHIYLLLRQKFPKNVSFGILVMIMPTTPYTNACVSGNKFMMNFTRWCGINFEYKHILKIVSKAPPPVVTQIFKSYPQINQFLKQSEIILYICIRGELGLIKFIMPDLRLNFIEFLVAACDNPDSEVTKIIFKQIDHNVNYRKKMRVLIIKRFDIAVSVCGIDNIVNKYPNDLTVNNVMALMEHKDFNGTHIKRILQCAIKNSACDIVDYLTANFSFAR